MSKKTEKKQCTSIELTMDAFNNGNLSWMQIVIADTKFKTCAQYAIEAFNEIITSADSSETNYGEISPDACEDLIDKQFPYLRQCFLKTRYCPKHSKKYKNIADNAMYRFSRIIAPYISFKNKKLVELVLPIAFFVLVMNNETSRHYIDKKQEYVKSKGNNVYESKWENKLPLVLNEKGKNDLSKIDYESKKETLTLLREAGISIELDLRIYDYDNENDETINPSDFKSVETIDYLDLLSDIMENIEYLWDVSDYAQAGLFLSSILQASFEQKVSEKTCEEESNKDQVDKDKVKQEKRINNAFRDLLLQLYIVNSFDCFLNKLDTDYESLSADQQDLRNHHFLLTAFFYQAKEGVDCRDLYQILDAKPGTPEFIERIRLFSFYRVAKSRAAKRAVSNIENCPNCSFENLYNEIKCAYNARNNALHSFYLNTELLNERVVFLDAAKDAVSLVRLSIPSVEKYITKLKRLHPQLICCYNEIKKKDMRRLIHIKNNL